MGGSGGDGIRVPWVEKACSWGKGVGEVGFGDCMLLFERSGLS